MKNIFDKNDWIHEGRWTQPPLSGCFWCHWNTAKSLKEIFPAETFDPCIFLDGHTFSSKADRERMINFLLKAEKDGTLAEFNKNFERVAKECERQHLAASSVEDLINTYHELVGVWWLTLPFGEEVQKLLLEKGAAHSEEELFSMIRDISKITWLEEHAIGIKTLAKNLKNEDLATHPLVKKHAKDFEWFGTHHWMGDGYTVDKCVEDIKQEIIRGVHQTEERQHDIKEKNPLVELMSLIFYWRTHCAETAAKALFASRGMLTQHAKKWNLDYDGLLFLSAKEILTQAPLPENYEQRKEKYGCYINSKKEECIIVGKEFDDVLNGMVQAPVQTSAEIKGSVACRKGKVVGTVCMLLSPKDFSNFKKGDVLVASETTPDYVPCMNNASAIITDTGGITSHAAIVARELNIPCVIGTKVATQVLKNGDRVEVDSEKGTVKII